MSRSDLARAEIARRREAAQAASPSGTDPDGWNSFDWGDGENSAIYCGPTEDGYRTGLVFRFAPSTDCEECVRPSPADLWHITLAADPAHVLAVLDAADATLDRHTPHERPAHGLGCTGHVAGYDPKTGDLVYHYWPCPDVAAVLDLYAPAAARDASQDLLAAP